MKIYNVFHPNLFQRISANLLINQVNEFLPTFMIDSKKNWEIKDILDIRN